MWISVVVNCLRLTAGLVALSSIVIEAQIVCRDNGCGNTGSCCTTSDYSCTEEHHPIAERDSCNRPTAPLTPEGNGVKICPITYEFERCSNSYSTNKSQTVGDFGKVDWVGVEFQSVSYETFSMTVVWEHKDAEILLQHSELSPVRGYEIRIYEKRRMGDSFLRECLCVTDPTRRNVSGIHTGFFTYSLKQDKLSHMSVEVRTYPSLAGEDDRNTRKNCSLMTGCAASNESEDCFSLRDECYSWPQSCLDFLPSYNSKTCTPPYYGPPTNVKLQMSPYHDNITNNTAMQLHLSWEPPNINSLFPAPNVYYITIENVNGTHYHFRAMNATSITILSLNSSMTYIVFVSAYVPCSGLANGISAGGPVGCGEECLVYSIPLTTWSSPIATTSLPTVTMDPLTTWSSSTATTSLPTVSTVHLTKNSSTIVVAVVVAFIAVILVCSTVFFLLIKNRCSLSRKIPGLSTLVLPHTPENNICVFVFYPRYTEPCEEAFIQTYIVAPLCEYRAFKTIKSADDPDFERGCIPESVDRSFRNADFIIIVCNSLLLHEWNSDHCSPSVKLLRQYIGNVSIGDDDSITKFITVVLDEQNKQQLIHSRQNLGSLRSFVINERTWDQEIPAIVGYMTRSPLFQVAGQGRSLELCLEVPDSPDPSTIDSPNSSQESSIPTASDFTFSDTDCSHNAYTLDS